MSFSGKFPELMEHPSERIRAFHRLLLPTDDKQLSAMAEKSIALTRQHFGKTMRLFAPIYLSNECINSCTYCGFSRENAILRTTLDVDSVHHEASHLLNEGFRNLLLVAGEHPKFVSGDYLRQCVERLAPSVPGISIEIAPMETDGYIPIVQAGAEGIVIYQETYHRETYRSLHLAGPKKDFDWRLDCPERAHAAGFRRIGIGALFGLHDWTSEALALATHLDYLQKTCWRSFLTVSLPRIRPAAGCFSPTHPFPDRAFIQTICALRISFPHVGIVLSTRESPAFRDLLAPLGVTMMSAGSLTEPGGYTGQGKADLHITLHGKRLESQQPASHAASQFEISDERTAAQIASMLRAKGLEPVWKDWDSTITKNHHAA